ncbi:OsmC family protein [Pseudonocardia kujensis]|uniref:OsmC family protein n=1 Tax=Pseudonocardia kujensis TaxID=1128675 RepID=UPI001E2B803E|nr:OsmC family protein [Pseudonocardia kujensis]MCE0765806.1 OsmC family protein [Pseudonocardia kujensis]
MGVSERSVSARWTGGLRAEVDAGGFTVVADEPDSAGGTGTGPQPTELLLAALASCFTLAIAYTARKRDVDLRKLEVDVTGRYEGLRFAGFTVLVRAAEPRGEELDRLVEGARRVCYVSNTLAGSPDLEVVAQSR